jgi:histidinol dehydrogenase
MRIIKATSKKLDKIYNRGLSRQARVEEKVKKIIDDVRLFGDEALLKYTKKFDGVKLMPRQLTVSEIEISGAYANISPNFVSSLKVVIENVNRFYRKQLRKSWRIKGAEGAVLGENYTPLEKVGIYIPAGTAPLVSTVYMTVLPAKLAGVKKIVLVSPPDKNGYINPHILVIADLLKVDEIYRVGGAQAIAALAYGTKIVPKVDKIVGPGNIYVATAKKLLYGMVDIDMIAGPSEILVLADHKANPKYIAADLMSQAEHDVLASAILVTTSERIADETIEELDRQIAELSRADIIRRSLNDFGAIIICDNTAQAVNIANRLAPEHLEVLLDNPMEYLGRLENAGSIFLGQYSPEPLGDYYAGPNHILPTSGTARFFSPLSVNSFEKRTSYIYYTDGALKQAKNDIILIAEREGLTAHANAIKVRF